MCARRRARGFTILEILIAVVLTTVGFAAVFALQIGTVQGNTSAREVTGAVALGERFVEALRREAHAWTQANPTTPRLSQAPRQWHTLTPAPVDHNGLPFAANVGSGLQRQRFCVHFWLDPQAGPYAGLMNARVRVVWPRALFDPTDDLVEVCTEAGARAFDARADLVARWYTLMLPASIRMHAAGGAP